MSDLLDSLERAARLRRDGRAAEAVALLTPFSQQVAWPWPAWHELGLALAADGQPASAASAFRRAAELGGADTAALWVNLGNALRSCGRKQDAIVAYRSGLGLEPGSAAAHYNLHAALYDAAQPASAIEALEQAHRLRPEHEATRFYLAALHAWHGHDERRAAALLDGLGPSAAFLEASLDFARRHRAARMFADTFDTLRFALGQAPEAGGVLELGVRRGTSLRFLAGLVAGEVVGFDSFDGLPESWGAQAPGLYDAGGALPAVPDNARLVPGLFATTLPAFVSSQPASWRWRFLNVDCDIYLSTRQALDALASRAADGAVLVFDEYLCNPGWEREEHRALREVAEREGWALEYLAFSLFTKQAVVRVRLR
jgi:Macrocin-O-methyltransferase (TylF)/Tetratricopeptide repeat